MKFMLIALNVLLAAGVCHLAWITVSDPVTLESKTPVATRSGIDKKSKQTGTAGSTALKEDPPSVVEEKIAALNAKNIFNVERVPEAPASKAAAARANNQQIRLGMSLVGTYSIGDALGAIILQRLQGNSQQLLKELQQKEYEQFLASSRVTDPKKKAQAESDTAKEGEDEVDETGDVVPGIRSITMNPSVSANNVIRQRLKVGDTTLNGYTLVEVTRTSATLTKGKETIELPLLTPSEASNQARQNNNRNNNNNNNNRNNNNNNNNNNNRNNQQANNNNNRNNNNNNANRNNNNNNNRNNNNNANRNNNNNNRNNNNNNNNRNNNRDDGGIIWF